MEDRDLPDRTRTTRSHGLDQPKTIGDRVLLLVVAVGVGAPVGGLLYALSVIRDAPPETLGDFALLEFLWLLFTLSVASAAWALFQPRWMALVLRNLATKTILVTLLAASGVLLWLLLLFLNMV